MADSPDDDLGRLTDELDERDAPTRWPIVAALAVVAVLVSVILIGVLSRRGPDRSSPDFAVRSAIDAHFSAANALDYNRFAGATCAAKTPSQAEFTAVNRRSVEENGAVEIPSITDVVIKGDTATATVHVRHAKKGDATTATPTTLVHQGGNWKVC